MRECTVCGEQDFEEQDGLFFCTTCNTQSQEVCVMLADEENVDNFQWSGRIKEKATPKDKPQKVKDYGRPWSVFEIYQIVIMHQVEALIGLGAHESLKEIVFQLWTNYLSKLGIAFSDAPPKPELLLERQRELFPSTTDNPKLKNVLVRRSRLRTQGLSAKKARKEMEKDMTAKSLQNEEFYEGDNPLLEEKQAEDEEKEEWSSGEEDEAEERWGRYRKRLKNNTVKKVRMISTLGVCFVGLMYTNPITTATDLICWVRSGKVPYLDISKLIPDDMKFQANDWKYFGQGIMPTQEQVRFCAGTIAHFLNLNDFPEFPLDELIQKYIMQLDLPVDLHSYIMNLRMNMVVSLKYVPVYTQKTTISWEGIAMAYIVILLKMMFALDDSTEIKMSECSEELMEICNCPQPLFVWTKWMQHMKNKIRPMHQPERTGLTYSATAESLDRQMSHRSFISHHQLYKPEVRELIANPFQQLSQRWKSRTDASSSGESSGFHDNKLPDLDHSLSSEEGCDVHQSEDRAEIKNSDQRKKLEKQGVAFRWSSMQHIVSPETFLKDLYQRKLSDNANSGEDDKFDLYKVIVDDQYVSNARSAKKNHQNYSTSTGSTAGLSNMARYQDIIQRLLSVKSNLQISLDFEDKSIRLNYEWLIKICSHLIDCNPKDLKMEVIKLEIMFLSENKDPGLTKRGHNLQKLVRNCNAFWLGKKIDTSYL